LLSPAPFAKFGSLSAVLNSCSLAMDGTKRTGYVWAISAGLNAAFAAIAAKFFSYQVINLIITLISD